LGGYENENLCGHENEEKKIDEETHILVAKRDGILPILPLLKVFGLLISGAAGVAKIINE